MNAFTLTKRFVNKALRLTSKIFFKLFPPKLTKDLTQNPKIGFAILSYERPEYLKLCLDSLYNSNFSKYAFTLLIIDDGSTSPEIKELINQKAPTAINVVRVFAAKGPNNAGAAINRALRQLERIGTFDILGWADPDCLFHPEWLNQTLDVCLWAKKYHNLHNLGPFTSFNSSDFDFHKIKGLFPTPYGNFVVKRQAGMLNYFFFRDDLHKIGYFNESEHDETDMTLRLETMGISNFCTEISWVEHIGEVSSLNEWRPDPIKIPVHGLNLAPDNWPISPIPFRKQSNAYYDSIDRQYQNTIKGLKK